MPLHSHKCKDRTCNRIWSHNTADIKNDDKKYAKAHECPDCGTEQRKRYFADVYDEAIYNLEVKIEDIKRLRELKTKVENGDHLDQRETLEAFMLLFDL